MKPNLALFDFDGTITERDTLFDYIRYTYGTRRYFKWMTLLLPWLVALTLKLASAQRVKERLLVWAIGGISLERFSGDCNKFCSNRLPLWLRGEALERIKFHESRGDILAIVSASPENWILPWANTRSIKVISTRLVVVDGKLTGRIAGLNCNGPEKVVRVKQAFNLNDFDKVYAYGDSKGDKELLALASNAYYRKFY